MFRYLGTAAMIFRSFTISLVFYKSTLCPTPEFFASSGLPTVDFMIGGFSILPFRFDEY